VDDVELWLLVRLVEGLLKRQGRSRIVEKMWMREKEIGRRREGLRKKSKKKMTKGEIVVVLLKLSLRS